jgi:gamma-glutamyl phosphate reductase
MATTVANSSTTQERLLRAREASAKLALLSTDEKNALLLKIADAIEKQAQSILEANREDVETSGLEGAMRDRLLKPPTESKKWRKVYARSQHLQIRSAKLSRSSLAPTACTSAKSACPLA